MTAPNQKPSTLSAIAMRLLVRKRMICCALICCCLVVLVWLTFQQGRSPQNELSEARWLHAKILLDPEETNNEGVIVRQEGDEYNDDTRRGGGGRRGNTGNLTADSEKDRNRTKPKKSPGEEMKNKKKKGSKKGDGAKTTDIENLGMNKEEAVEWLMERIKRGYCNPPNREITGEEGTFKPGYELKSSYVVVRHGDRTPIGEFSNIPNVTWDPRWSCDLKLAGKKKGNEILGDFVQKMGAELKTRSGNMQDVSRYFKTLPMGTGLRCQKSQLTPTGWIQHMKLGGFLRKAYGRTLVPKPEELRNASVFKSTVNSRTQQSAFSFMYGFLGDAMLADTSKIKTVPSINFCPLDMCACPALDHLVKEKEAQHSKLMHANDDFMKVMRNIAQTLYGTTQTSRLPGVNGVAEILATLLCHSMLYPCGADGCLKPLHHALYTRYIEDNWQAQAAKEDGLYEKLGRMFIHPFLTDMTKHWYKISQGGGNRNRFVFHSGHDITLRPMVDALKLKGPSWPPYASRIVFELWKKSSSREHFLRVLGYGEDQTHRVEFCREQLNDDGLCPFSALLSFVETDNMEYFYSDSFQDACSRTYWPDH